jgi:hypothetical protein
MKIKISKGIEKKLDLAWSKLVKLRADMKCEVCSKTTYLNSHHIYTRARKSVRWDVMNGVCCCAGCHVLSSKFSFHKTPLEAFEWLEKNKGAKFLQVLRIKANTISKLHPFEKELLLIELEKEIKQTTIF